MTIRSMSTCDDDDNDNDDSDNVSYIFTSLDQSCEIYKHKLRSKVIKDVEQFIQGDGYIKRGSYEYVPNKRYKRIVKRAISRSDANRSLGTIPPAVDKAKTVFPESLL